MFARSKPLLVLVALALTLGACSNDAEPPTASDETPTPTVEPKCPLTGFDVPAGVRADRPAVAIKIENNPSAYPLSGLDDAEIVFEEEVEGGLTRFMAIFHCTDSKKAGPVRSARVVDPAIMTPITKILGDAGGNGQVKKALDKGGIVSIDETAAGSAMRRVPRSGYSSEHTLYANTAALRKIGQKKYDKPPPQDLFDFNVTGSQGKKVKTLTATFSQSSVVVYRWKRGAWMRFDHDSPLTMESGTKIAVDNVILELHKVNYSKKITDVLGNPSIEIADAVGKGTAIVFRGGTMIKGTWERKSLNSAVRYETKDGKPIALQSGTTWIELLPDKSGEVKGSYSVSKK
ncbi:MAG TPA: DUF3048 domain-containing protein [Actinomycetota bacterium]|nr:DUF3048 domain-containing protein [Actinomycetota bacterium]